MSNAVGAAIFFLIAPTTVAGVLPYLITGWTAAQPFLGLDLVRWLGLPLVATGLLVIVDAFMRFVREGEGTPAPVAAPRHLVVRGPYRWVRNPMYVATLAMIVGQALIFRRRVRVVRRRAPLDPAAAALISSLPSLGKG